MARTKEERAASDKARYEKCREKILAQKREYRQKNAEKRNARNREYRLANAEKIKERRRAYRQRASEIIKAYKQKNRERVKAWDKRYKETHRKKIRDRLKERRATDPNFRARIIRWKRTRRIIRREEDVVTDLAWRMKRDEAPIRRARYLASRKKYTDMVKTRDLLEAVAILATIKQELDHDKRTNKRTQERDPKKVLPRSP